MESMSFITTLTGGLLVELQGQLTYDGNPGRSCSAAVSGIVCISPAAATLPVSPTFVRLFTLKNFLCCPTVALHGGG
jgi:hypothetical protein